MKYSKPTPNLSLESLQQSFEALLLDDPNMKELRKIVEKKSKHIFEVICRESDELTFSRTLKYFLDPSEAHHLGSTILRSFLHAVIASDPDSYRAQGITRLEIDLLNLDEAKVYREYGIGKFGRLDIFIDIPQQLAVLIEVKLYADEGISEGEMAQTVSYTRWATENLSTYKRRLCAFVTPSGVIPAAPSFSPIDFGELHQIFQENLEVHSLDDRDRLLLDNVSKWINELKPMDPKIVNLCRNIYKKYKTEIDLLIDNRPSIEALYKDVVLLLKDQRPDLVVISGLNWVCFSPKSWMSNKALAVGKKYSLPRVEYVWSEDIQALVLVIPSEGQMHQRILASATEIFHKDQAEAKADGYKRYGNLYLTLGSKEPIVPENLVNSWEEEVERLSMKAVEETTRIANLLTPEYLVGGAG